MQDKLQELTDKLYNEGLSKGKEEGEELLAKAKKQASEIVEQAKAEAAQIKTAAEKETADFKVKVDGDLKMAASQSLQSTKQEIENLILTKMVDKDIAGAMTSADFVKETIKAVAQRFNAQEATDLSLVLPDTLKSALEPFIQNELGQILKGGVEATFSKKITGGFKIGPKDGSYFISLTDETFKELICEYLRPATKKLLFGE